VGDYDATISQSQSDHRQDMSQKALQKNSDRQGKHRTGSILKDLTSLEAQPTEMLGLVN
jgi:hypothetical protein